MLYYTFDFAFWRMKEKKGWTGPRQMTYWNEGLEFGLLLLVLFFSFVLLQGRRYANFFFIQVYTHALQKKEYTGLTPSGYEAVLLYCRRWIDYQHVPCYSAEIDGSPASSWYPKPISPFSILLLTVLPPLTIDMTKNNPVIFQSGSSCARTHPRTWVPAPENQAGSKLLVGQTRHQHLLDQHPTSSYEY